MRKAHTSTATARNDKKILALLKDCAMPDLWPGRRHMAGRSHRALVGVRYGSESHLGRCPPTGTEGPLWHGVARGNVEVVEVSRERTSFPAPDRGGGRRF